MWNLNIHKTSEVNESDRLDYILGDVNSVFYDIFKDMDNKDYQAFSNWFQILAESLEQAIEMEDEEHPEILKSIARKYAEIAQVQQFDSMEKWNNAIDLLKEISQ